MRPRSLWTLAVTLGFALALAPEASAQIVRGNIYGHVTDQSGAVLPGVTVTLSGVLGTQSTVTDSEGAFRFLGVDQGTHKITVSLAGFGAMERQVIVTTGANVEVTFAMRVAGVEETMTVVAETPLIDTKKVGTATAVTRDELAGIPSSRDPWALMRTIPGVMVDRVNIAGSESGQQSAFVSSGSNPKDAQWSLDGVVITDMAAIGSSPTYYTYDAFDEVDFVTGGGNVTVATGGLGVNIAPKRGTNEFHGGFGGYFTHDDLQSSNLPDELENDTRLQGSDKADHTDQIADWSVDLGGPIVKDKLWFYGSFGKNDIRIRSLNQGQDKSVLKNYTAKVNWQATQNDMVSAFWFQGAKDKIGRLGSSGSLEHLEGTRWDQGGFYPRDPPGLSKIEWNHIFNPSFFLNAKGSYYSTGFSLEPQGGIDEDKYVLDNVNFQARGTTRGVYYLRPQKTFSLDGTYFGQALGGSHEIRFGGTFRGVDSSSHTIYPGQKAQARFNPTSTRARFYRDALSESTVEYWSGYASDTFAKDRLTLSLGLRWDFQRAGKQASGVPGNPLIPDLLPGFEYPGDGDNWAAEWNDLSPRVGFTLALDEERKTVLRGSYGYYAGQMGNGSADWNNPVGASYLEYDWRDLNGDEIVQLPEVDFSRVRGSGNVDPRNPSAIGESPNTIDPDYHSNKDHQVIAGLDRELMPNLAASISYTWRKSTDLTPTQGALSYWYGFTGLRPSDFVVGETECANGYCATSYILDEAAFDRPEVTGGFYLTNRQGYSSVYNGIEVSFIKRMSDKWMGRLAFTWADWKENIGPEATAISNPAGIDKDPKIDGGQRVYYSAGTSGKVYYQNAKWQMAANALYQLPAGFEVAANVFGRQGYPNPIFASMDLGALDGQANVLAEGTKIDTDRFPALWDIDLRLAKNVKLGDTTLVVSAEVFNVLNANTELNRVNQFNASTYGRLDEILAPRILRFGARLRF